MTITTTSNSDQYAGNGSTATFAFNYPITAEGDLIVVLTDSTGVDTTQTLTTDYTVSVASYPGLGSITMVTVPAVGETLTIRRILALTQSVDLQNQGAFFAETHESAFDRYVMVDQQQQDALNRSLHFPVSEASGYSAELPNESTRLGGVLGFNAVTGNPEIVAGLDGGLIPAPGSLGALDYLRVNAAQTAFEGRTAPETVTDLGLEAGATADQTGAEIAALMGGEEILLDADGDTSITADTDDQVDIKIGGSDVLKFVPAGIAGDKPLRMIEQLVASASSSLDFETGIDSTHDHYLFVLKDLLITTDGNDMSVRVSIDGGSTYETTGKYSYHSVTQRADTAGITSLSNITSGSAFTVTSSLGNAAGEGVSGYLWLHAPASSGKRYIKGELSYMDNTATAVLVKSIVSGAYIGSSSAVDAFRFFAGSNLASGTITLYGLKD